ncbi:hypothetical protein [Caulobacter zeae]
MVIPAGARSAESRDPGAAAMRRPPSGWMISMPRPVPLGPG